MDDIVFTQEWATNLIAYKPTEVRITKKLLHFPVKSGAPTHKVKIEFEGKTVRYFDIELAPGEPDFWVLLDVQQWKGKTLTIVYDKIHENRETLTRIEQSDSLHQHENLYQEDLRQQFHFSAQRGWLNDPNGLVYYKGEYHLFFQHNPYGWNWGNMHWGHAVSNDLIHWKELGEALYPDEKGTMFSGSAVVDWNNTSGFGNESNPPLVLIYTSAGDQFTQCLAYSNDGRHFTKYSGNPVVTNISEGNRDPKVFWHELTKQWIMALYVGLPNHNETIHYFGSHDLKDWNLLSKLEGYYECPDMFDLPLDRDSKRIKWVVTAANSDYQIGSFDGTTFSPETPMLHRQFGEGYYAAQTISDEPRHRRVQIGWQQAPSPGMSFNHSMGIPQELSLRATPDGPRLVSHPVDEVKSLYTSVKQMGEQVLKEGAEISVATGEAMEIRTDFVPEYDNVVSIMVDQFPITYEAKTEELIIKGKRIHAPLQSGCQKMILYIDRTSIELFASEGLVYAPFPLLAESKDRNVRIVSNSGSVKFTTIDVSSLRSIWNNTQ